MGKNSDPVSQRQRALNEQIAALESQIKQLDTQLGHTPPPGKFRSTALPQGVTIQRHTPPAPAPEPVFEETNQQRLHAERLAPQEHFNELGVRKYDFSSLILRAKNYFQGPSANNPRLVNYLAAGGVQGLRPMRYEKRVARNRLIVFIVILFFALLCLLAMALKNYR